MFLHLYVTLLEGQSENADLEDCQTPFFETVNGTRVCVSDCGGRFVDGRECVDACQSGAFEDVTGKLTYKKCVDLGSCSHYVREDVQIGESTVNHAHCIDSCPDTFPVITVDSTRCKTCEEVSSGQKPYWTGSGESESACTAICESRRYKQVGTSKICVNMCEEGKIANIPGEDGMSQCTTGCSTEIFADVNTENDTFRQCVEIDECGRFVSEKMPFTINKRGVWYKHCYGKSCPVSHPYTVPGDETCYDICPEIEYYAPLSGYTCNTGCGYYQVVVYPRKCACDGGLEENADKTECIPPADKSWKDFGRVCRWYGRVVSLTGDECTGSCGENEHAQDNMLCVCDKNSILHESGSRCIKEAECPSIYTDDTRQPWCVDKCPGNSWFRDDRQCETCAMRNWLTPYRDGESCVVACPFERPQVENGVCNACPAGLAWNGLDCVSCSEINEATPVAQAGYCRPCRSGDGGLFWNGETCVAQCSEAFDVMRVCRSCVDLSPEKPVWKDGSCMSQAEADGDFPTCDDDALEFDPLVGRCVCRNGSPLSTEDSAQTCGSPCASGIRSFAEPERCVGACPPTMVLHRSGDHLFCEECADYVYYDPDLQRSSCVSYAQCRLDMRMEARIVYEDGQAFRVCTLPPARVALGVHEEWLPDVSGAIEVYWGSCLRQHYMLVGSHVLFSAEDFIRFTNLTKAMDLKLLADDALTLVTYDIIRSALSATGERKSTHIAIAGSLPQKLQAEDERIVYIDGIEHFGAEITASGEFICICGQKGTCPDTTRIPEQVHEVAFVSSQDLVLRLRSGALYYKSNGEWVVDNEATQAGSLNGSLFRLLRNGTVLRDNETLCEGKHNLLVTDSAVYADGKVIYSLEDGDAETVTAPAELSDNNRLAVEDQLEYRSNLLVLRRKTKVRGENGCPDGQFASLDGCVFGCPGFVSDDGKRCYPELPEHMAVRDGRFAACAFGFVAAADGYSCECQNFVSVDGKSCDDSCGVHQKKEGNRCVCESDYLVSVTLEKHCALPGEVGCKRVIDDGKPRCTAEETCVGGLKLDLNGHTCVPECQRWTEDANTKELQCVEVCPEGTFFRADGQICSASCESKIFKTVPAGDSTHNACLENTDSCRDTATKNFHIDNADVEYTQCLDACQTGKYLNGNTCVFFCPAGTFVQTDGKTCGANCPTGFYKQDEKHNVCVKSCSRAYVKRYRKSDTLTLCAKTCPQGTADADDDGFCTKEEHCDADKRYDLKAKTCVCAADGYALTEEGNCVVPSAEYEGCKRRAKIGGVMRCLSADVCKGDWKLVDDGFGYTCVSSCPSEKFEEDENTKELRCVEDCAHWWYRAEDGLCTEQKWRKSTAIAVPVVVVVVIAGVLLAVLMLRRKGKKQQKPKSEPQPEQKAKQPEQPMRETVAEA